VFRAVSIITVFVAVLGAGLVSGMWSGRWSGSARSEEAAARLVRVPKAIGDWVGDDLPARRGEREAAEAAGLLNRRYVNSRTGAMVTLMLVCGRAGPVSVHPPEVCFGANGFSPAGPEARFDVPGAPGNQLWVRRFEKTSGMPINLRLFYGWAAAGSWEAPDRPRLKYAGGPLLFKMYVGRELTRPDEPLEGDPAADFLRAIAPSLKAALFPEA